MATSDAAILSVFRDGSREPLATAEVADALECSRRTAYNRLDKLADDGAIRTKKVGARARVWWLADGEGEPAGGGRTDGDSTPERDRMFSTLVENLPGMVYRCRNETGWPMSYVSDGCRALTGYDPETIESDSVLWGEDVIHPDDRERVWRDVQAALDERRPFTLTYRIHRKDGSERWVWEQGRGIYDGGDLAALEGYITDVTEREERDRRLQRFQERAETLVRAQGDEIPVVATEIAAELVDLPLSGVHLVSEDGTRLEPAAVTDAVDDHFDDRPVYERGGDRAAVSDLVWEVFETGESVSIGDTGEESDVEAGATPARSGIVYPLGDHGVFIASSTEPDAVDAINRTLAELLATNLTAALDRADRERRLRRSKRHFEAVFHDPETFIGLLDPDGTLRRANRAALEFVGADPADVEGQPFHETPWWDHSTDLQADLREWIDRAAAGEYVEFEADHYGVDDRRIVSSGVVRPVTDEAGTVVSVIVECRDVSERKRRERQLRRSEQRYRRLLETSPGPIFIYDVEGRVQYANDAAVEFLGAEDRAELYGTQVEAFTANQDRQVVARRHRRIVEEGEAVPPVEEELRALDGETKHAMVASAPVTFEGDDAIQTVAIDVTDRVEQRRELRRQRDRIETLNWLNELVQETAHVVAESSTREEIERLVCQRLANSESFDGAWIGQSATDGGVDLRFEAGSTDSDDVIAGEAAAAEALDDGEWRTFTHPGADGPDRAGIAVPVAHEDVRHGVLAVVADQDSITDYERTVVSRLADILGHALAAVQRKAALMGQSAIELKFRSTETFGPVLEATRETGATITLDRAIPLDDTTALYCTLDGATLEAFSAAVGPTDLVRSFRRLGEDDTGTRFEVVVEGRTVVSKVAAVGGRIRDFRITDGGVRLVAQVPDGSDVRALVEAIQTDHPDYELVARERVDRSESEESSGVSPTELLTDRQRAAIEAAFFAGYFERPRRSTGEEVAEVLGVSPATFHEHLRIAERKLLQASLSPTV